MAAVIAQEPQTAQWLLQQALPRLEVAAFPSEKKHESYWCQEVLLREMVQFPEGTLVGLPSWNQYLGGRHHVPATRGFAGSKKGCSLIPLYCAIVVQTDGQLPRQIWNMMLRDFVVFFAKNICNIHYSIYCMLDYICNDIWYMHRLCKQEWAKGHAMFEDAMYSSHCRGITRTSWGNLEGAAAFRGISTFSDTDWSLLIVIC